jgi:NADPH:quinone reductase-like Zn-dependent oxidoreductase
MGCQVWSQILRLTTKQKFRAPLALVNQADLRVLTEMLEAGKLRPIIDRRYPLDEVPTAVRALAAGHSRGKAVITIASDGVSAMRPN